MPPSPTVSGERRAPNAMITGETMVTSAAMTIAKTPPPRSYRKNARDVRGQIAAEDCGNGSQRKKRVAEGL